MKKAVRLSAGQPFFLKTVDESLNRSTAKACCELFEQRQALEGLTEAVSVG